MTWRTVPTTPTADMRTAFACEIRIQAGLLPADGFAHEPLGPLWDAVLAVAPEAPPAHPPRALVTKSAVEGYAAGIRDVVDLARRTAAALDPGNHRPIPIGFAIEALTALADEAEALLLAAPTPSSAP